MRPSDPVRIARGVGRRVAEIRRERGWTQQDLAERLNVSVQYLRRIELAQTNLTVPRLVEVANALGVRVPALFETPASLTVKRGRPKHLP